MDREYTDGTEPTSLPHLSRSRPLWLPAGCDQQGRWPTRPEPAEAATHVGADEDAPSDRELVTGVLRVLLVACALLGTILFVGWLAVRT